MSVLVHLFLLRDDWEKTNRTTYKVSNKTDERKKQSDLKAEGIVSLKVLVREKDG